ncbi:MAG: hypothetical protein HOV87_20370 [Catenulispora sp.]|nr:hypothetical protein [Catenulispora sp.]
MSSTSAVAVLAQGLRDLRDFAEGPDPAELSRRTGLTGQQIDTALAGEQLPSREVTLALVTAWEGDVEAWDDYWAQIAELAQDDGAEPGGAEASAVPVAPEPSIITPLPAQEPEPEEGRSEEAAEHTAEPAEPTEASEAVEATEPAEAVEAKEPAEAAAAAGAAVQADQDEESDEVGNAELAAEAEPAAAAVDSARAEPAGDDSPAPLAEHPTTSEPASTAEPAATALAPAADSAAPAETPPQNKRVLARAGIPGLVFVVGVAVGAFGDHALRSKSASSQTVASLSPASQSHSSQPSAANPTTTTPSRGVSTSSAAVAGSPSASSASTFSTSSTSSSTSSQPSGSDSSGSSSVSSASSASSSSVASGTSLGTYTGIQLASSYSVDFFHDPYHPVSGTSNGPDSMGFFATSFVDGTFYADQVAILDPQETGSYAACLNNTRYQKDVPLSKVSAGSAFCIHTSTGHLVLVTVRRMPSSTDSNPYAVVDLAVWQD